MCLRHCHVVTQIPVTKIECHATYDIKGMHVIDMNRTELEAQSKEIDERIKFLLTCWKEAEPDNRLRGHLQKLLAQAHHNQVELLLAMAGPDPCNGLHEV